MGDHDNADALRQADLAKIPTFTGHKSADTFSAEQWADRIQRSKDASDWDDARTMCYVLNALRGEALLWYKSCRRTGISTTVWADFKRGFLHSFSTTITARSTTINLGDLSQGQNERISTFYPRVIATVDDLEALLTGPAIPANPWTPEVTAVAQFMALDVAVRAAQATKLADFGSTRAFNHMALTLFVNNLKPHFREDMLKTPPTTLAEAYDKAIEFEKIQNDAHKKPLTQPMMPVSAAPAADTAESEDQLQSELDDLLGQNQAKIDALQSKLRRFQNKSQSGPRSGNGPTSTNTGKPWRAPANPAAKGKKCRYCHKLNHFQYDCNARRRANAPMVGPDGKQYTPRTGNQAEVLPTSDQVVYASSHVPMSYMQMPPGYPQGQGQGYNANNPDFQ